MFEKELDLTSWQPEIRCFVYLVIFLFLDLLANIGFMGATK